MPGRAEVCTGAKQSSQTVSSSLCKKFSIRLNLDLYSINLPTPGALSQKLYHILIQKISGGIPAILKSVNHNKTNTTAEIFS